MDFRKKAIELYEKGTNIEEIRNQTRIPIITEESIKKWIEEDNLYKEAREKTKKITKLIRTNNNYKKQIKYTYSPQEKEKLWNLIVKNLDEILEIDPQNEIAIGEKIKSYINLQQFGDAKLLAEGLLEKNPENIIALNYLARIERNNGNLECEKEYLEKIIELSSEEEQQKATMRLSAINRILSEKAELDKKQIKNTMQSRDEKQKEYADKKADENIVFTKEEQEDYINQKYKEFIEGKVQKTQIAEMIEELKKYPDETRSMLFLVDLYSKITGKYESSIEKLEQYKMKNKLSADEIETVNEEIKGYRNILSFEERQEQIENEERKEKQKQIKEQREYSKFILGKIKKGKIKKEELPEIVERLESYPDKARSIFLITKIYEIIEGRNSALKMLAKYTKVKDLSDYERRKISEMEEVISEKIKHESSTTERIKRIYLKKQQAEERKEKRYERKIQKETVINYVEEGKTIEQIKKLLQSNGTIMTITSIRNIMNKCAKYNEKIQERIGQSRKTVSDLLEAGYEPNQVYKMVGHEISLKEIKQMTKEKEDIELSH